MTDSTRGLVVDGGLGAMPFILGTHYYRPPFPDAAHWEADLAAMRAAGLNAVQLWLVWGWCEPEPGRFVFDDYDRLADVAQRQGLGLVLAVLPELNPFWLPRVVPDGVMIDVEGRTVLSGARGECLSGLTPGLCSDHPAVRARMVEFMQRCAAHFGPRPNLLAWDCWNENRWRNQAPDTVCFCPHSLASLRAFLEERYGSLAGLGRAWGRRYASWEDVRIGRMSAYMGVCHPEMRDFSAWLVWRGREMCRWRTAALKAGDARHPVASHAGTPTVTGGANLNEPIFNRGIDWEMDAVDAYGASTFGKTSKGASRPLDYWIRMNTTTTVGGGRKPFWISELQGGQTMINGVMGPPLPGAEQQSWMWTGIARGAKACLFWCWRNEVFGAEANGFGLTANDGFAEDRLAALRRSAAVIGAREPALLAYRPDPAPVAVLFQRDAYILDWLRSKTIKSPAYEAPRRVIAFAEALERLNLAYEFHDDRHLPETPEPALKCVIVPDAQALDDAAAQWLLRFARGGGTVLIEGIPGAHGPDTFWRYPGERPLHRELGVLDEVQRAPTRTLRTIPAGALGNARELSLALAGYEATFAADSPGVVRLGPDDLPMMVNVPLERGRVINVAALFGHASLTTHADGTPAADDGGVLCPLLECVAELAGVRPAFEIAGDGDGACTARLGQAGDRRLLMIVNMEGQQRVSLRLEAGLVPVGATLDEWFGHDLTVARARHGAVVELDMDTFDQAVIEW